MGKDILKRRTSF